ncbi:hypothetical protein [uncultured Methanobrevibacter sp.]|uniref:hypothetical protein n=1 Tax=uncultured Methanobrevibacter sp. TaxID=253161 RepID=UPI0025D0E43B|nr:hypothetical protein [uncultured Methanobrevibacter sp.]
MKERNQILVVILILLSIYAIIVSVTYYIPLNQQNVITSSIVGNNTNGTVYKTICGNTSSNDTVVLILGVHSFESGIHNATNKTVLNLTKENNLTKKYVVYFIKVNMNASGIDTEDYQTNRHMGELLANKYIVKDLIQYNPIAVVDVHEMEAYWDPTEFIEVINTNSSLANEYGHKLSNDTGIKEYTFTEGTSPEWVTIPIANEGFNTIIFETAQADSNSDKMKTAEKLIRSLDSFKIRK